MWPVRSSLSRIFRTRLTEISCFLASGLARRGKSGIFCGMFELTRSEQKFVIGFVVVFLLGLGVKQWRDAAGPASAPAAAAPQ